MEVAKDYRKNPFEASPTDIVVDSTVANNSVEEPVDPVHNVLISPTAISVLDSSHCTLACDQSLLSGDVDRWMRGSVTTETRAVQHSRWKRPEGLPPPTVVQRSIEAANERAALPSTDVAWHMIALTMMPLLNAMHIPQWRCTHSIVVNAMELACAHLSTACSRLRAHVRRLAQHQLTRELLAAAMDVVLVIYAMGFLLLSVYQAAILT